MRFGATLLFFVALAPSALAMAQDSQPTQAEMAAARRLFGGGHAHAQAGRWAEALESFEQSYAIAAVPVTLLNLAEAQMQVGKLVAATESYRRFLQRANTGRARRYRATAEEALAALEPRVPSVRFEVTGLEHGDQVRIDEDDVAQAVLSVEYALDPGPHSVRVTRAGQEVAQVNFELAEGAQEQVRLVVEAATPAAMLSGEGAAVAAAAQEESADGAAPSLLDEPAAEEDDGGLLASPWFWGGVGAVVVGGVVAAVLIGSGGTEVPFLGTLGSGEVEYR